jgi:prevent-host-death family protein
MIELPRLSIREARARLADVVDQAGRDQPTVITRRGIPVAAVVPIDTLRRYLELEEREVNLIIDERMSERSEVAVPLEDVLRETLSRDE